MSPHAAHLALAAPTPGTRAHDAAMALRTQAAHIAACSDLAHRTAGLVYALILWGRACDVARRACPAGMAADTLRHLAREQDDVAAWTIRLDAEQVAAGGLRNATNAKNRVTLARALVTSRGEAARAIGNLFAALPGGDAAAVMVAHTQRDTLHGAAPIPSATLRTWAAAWHVYSDANNGGRPAWPRWRDVPRSPWELSVLLARVDGGAAAVERLAEEVEAWAREWDGRQAVGEGRAA